MLRALDERGQALSIALGSIVVLMVGALVMAAIGGAVTGKGRVQRGADLIAISTVRSMRDDYPRLFEPPYLPDGRRNPRHMSKSEYLARARRAGVEAAARNEVATSRVAVSFPDARSFAPLRARARVTGELVIERPITASGRARSSAIERAPAVAEAEAEAAPGASPVSGMPAVATGGGYSGPLAYRQGKPMRPDVAAAFDRLQSAARRAGLQLVISFGYRSDAEQARLFARNPDPRWVAPPGRSLHRCGTELDVGPPAAYRWLDANAPSFGFLRRYSWEEWHFGYVAGPAPCSAAGEAVDELGDEIAARTAQRGDEFGDGDRRQPGGLPSFVPARFRAPIERAAARWNVSAALLAAQLMAESNFNPFAVSPVGARGIAQFMPGTARAYRLRNPFDAAAAIDAQAHLMSDLLRRFHSIPLALAAYNAGPGAVQRYNGIPPFRETQAYVARILGLLDGAGELPGATAPTLEVRLVA